jgi:prepilin-type N-terminal cleavage/methylation domain-containing protein
MKNKKISLRQALAVLRREDGLTLLELMVVLAIVVAVAGITTGAFTQVDRTTRADLTRTEMQQVAAAIRQFRQDTGYYPKQGIFDHASNVPPGLVTAAAEAQGPFNSPANLRQLFFQPTTDGTTAILPFDIDSGRGWRGPYLKRENLVDVGENLVADGTGFPDTTADPDTSAHKNVPGVADPQDFSPETGLGPNCEENVGNTLCIFDWRPIPGDPAFLTHGRPFLYFIDVAAEPNVDGCDVPCLVALGANGSYEPDIVTFPNRDDIVVSVN